MEADNRAESFCRAANFSVIASNEAFLKEAIEKSKSVSSGLLST